MNNKLKPAIIGGIVVGLLSAIPFVNLPNFCCCLWALLGGALAAYMFVKSSPTPVKSGDGALLGALAGLVGGLIYIVVGIPLGIVLGGIINAFILSLLQNVDRATAYQIRRQMMGQTIIVKVVYGFVWAILLIVFSTIGGLLGVAIFEKRKGDAPPLPQGFGGTPGGGYGSAA
jgi:uncharacterized protein YqgC (DUF456 family)